MGPMVSVSVRVIGKWQRVDGLMPYLSYAENGMGGMARNRKLADRCAATEICIALIFENQLSFAKKLALIIRLEYKYQI